MLRDPVGALANEPYHGTPLQLDSGRPGDVNIKGTLPEPCYVH